MYYPPPQGGQPFLRPLCAQHPDREALGICVMCRRPVCAECSTPIEGINRCASCIAALAQAAEIEAGPTRDDHHEARAGNLAALLFFGGLVFLMVYGLTYCAGG